MSCQLFSLFYYFFYYTTCIYESIILPLRYQINLSFKITVMKTLEFNIEGRTETHRGTATIVDNYRDGIVLADDAFSVFEGDVICNRIGNCEGYTIYESYVDSGSDDYFYFAVPTGRD